jgi:hypothetical protein
MPYDPFTSPTSPLSDTFRLNGAARRSRQPRLTPVQQQILLFLGTGGPSYIVTGSSTTHCGLITGGRRCVRTNSTTLHFLVHHRLVIRDAASDTYAANRKDRRVAKLLDAWHGSTTTPRGSAS